jgi:hypothetical protein
MIQTDQKKNEFTGVKRIRPLVLELLCIFSFIFFGMITILFLLSVFYSGWITDVVNQYTLQDRYPKTQILIITLGGFILHATAFAGAIQIWNLKRSGYYLFSISVLIIAVYHLFHHNIPVSYTSLYIALAILFGLFYRKFR